MPNFNLIPENNVVFNDKTRENIEGWLLGDGSIESHTKRARFRFCSIHEEYSNYVRNILELAGLKCHMKRYESKNLTRNSKPQYVITTPSTVQFKEIGDLWYEEKKVIPENLELTNIIIKNWIMDDGSRNNGRLILSTDCFTYEENIMLSEKINKIININACSVFKKGNNYSLGISRIGTNRLLDIIGECPVKCFEYKWIKVIKEKDIPKKISEIEILENYKNGNSIASISKNLNIKNKIVKEILDKNNITRVASETRKIQANRNINELEVLELYKENNIKTIAKQHNVDIFTIKRILRSNRIDYRDEGEKKKDICISRELRENIDGWLLGDGGISKRDRIKTDFRLSSKYEEYVEYVGKKFEDEGIKTKIQKRIHPDGKISYTVRSAALRYLQELYFKWYPEGKKIVPKDIELSKNLMKNWIMDDGTISKIGVLTLCTHGFGYDDNIFLVNKINEYFNFGDAKVKKDSRGYWKISVSRIGTNIIFERVGKSPILCFEYKWNKLIVDIIK